MGDVSAPRSRVGSQELTQPGGYVYPGVPETGIYRGNGL